MHTVCFNELCKKEVICECDGRKLGFPCDIQFDGKCGQILYITLNYKSPLSIFGGKGSIKIPWCDVSRIGEDVIWVSDCPDLPLQDKCTQNY